MKANDKNSEFYLAYLKFEIRFLEKLMHRRNVLEGHEKMGKSEEQKKKENDMEFDFIDDEEEQMEGIKFEENENIEGEMRKGEEANLVKIVTANLIKKFAREV